MTNVVLPFISESMPFWMSFSVRVSIDEVASSRMSTGGSATAARAIARSWRSPCERLPPSAERTVLYPWGRRLMKESAYTSFAASMHSSSVASRRPYRMLSRTEAEKRQVS